MDPDLALSYALALSFDGCPPGRPVATLVLWRSPNDICSAPSARTPFVDSTELALVLGEPHATVHRVLADLLAEGIVGRVNHGTIHLPSSQRYHLTTNGVGEAAWTLGFATPSDFVRAYPMSREWLTLLIRRMDTVASVLPSRSFDVPRHRRASVQGGVPSKGALRRHHHPPRRPQLRHRAPGVGPAAAVSLRPAEGHSGSTTTLDVPAPSWSLCPAYGRRD